MSSVGASLKSYWTTAVNSRPHSQDFTDCNKHKFITRSNLYRKHTIERSAPLNLTSAGNPAYNKVLQVRKDVSKSSVLVRRTANNRKSAFNSIKHLKPSKNGRKTILSAMCLLVVPCLLTVLHSNAILLHQQPAAQHVVCYLSSCSEEHLALYDP